MRQDHAGGSISLKPRARGQASRGPGFCHFPIHKVPLDRCCALIIRPVLALPCPPQVPQFLLEAGYGCPDFPERAGNTLKRKRALPFHPLNVLPLSSAPLPEPPVLYTWTEFSAGRKSAPLSPFPHLPPFFPLFQLLCTPCLPRFCKHRQCGGDAAPPCGCHKHRCTCCCRAGHASGPDGWLPGVVFVCI